MAMDKTGDSQRTIPTPFLTKTYQLVDDPALDEMISWNEHGNAFIVWKPAEFARDLLPKYFKHNNYSSFIRQLNTYGFRKIVSDRWEFANDYFRRGEKSLLREIHRRKIITPTTQPTPAVTTSIPIVAMPVSTSGNSSEERGGSSNSSPTATMINNSQSSISRTHLIEENERLKEQNCNLRCELDHLRSMCCNVVTMMSNFMVGQQEIIENASLEKVVEGGGGDPMEEEKMCPRLFGVSIGAKRVRRLEENAIGERPDDEMQEQTSM
ncbi:heat stress transcription factor B-2b-like [Bidens hawaiensis]|uniref:heat stress transcription factor B-2b-like n=1 Tax=Bidens hawaiensis TaxID=980011 RepID=UPI00404AE1A3